LIKHEIPLEVRIPANLDTNSLIPTPLKEAKRAKYRDGMCYFLDLLLPKPWDFKKRKQLTDCGFIRLRIPDLKRIIGPEYDDIITWLAHAGVIKVNPKYIIGKHSRGYRITQQYFIETVPVTVTNKGMCERYWKQENEAWQVRNRNFNKISFVTWLFHGKEHKFPRQRSTRFHGKGVQEVLFKTAGSFIRRIKKERIKSWQLSVF